MVSLAVNANPGFKVMVLLKGEYLINGRTLIGTCRHRLWNGTTSDDLEWPL